MGVLVACVLGLLGGLHGSRVEETEEMEMMKEMHEKALDCRFDRSKMEEMERSLERTVGFDTKVLIPVIFHGSKVVASPVTRYWEIEKEERRYAERVIKLLPGLAWHLMVCVYVEGCGDWISDLTHKVFSATSFWRPDLVALYKNGKKRDGMKFVDLVVEVFRRNRCMVGRFGDSLARLAEARLQRISGSLSPGERKKEEEMLWKIKEYGERLCTKERQEEIVRAQKIMCDACARIWGRESDRRSFVLEAYSKHLCLRMVDPSVGVEGLLAHCMDHSKLIRTYEKHQVDVAGELVLQVFLGNKDIDDESINNAVREVRERKEAERIRKEEEMVREGEERAKNEEELLRMVEREEREEREKRESKEEDGKEEEGVEAEEEESAEVPLVETAVGRARRKKKGSREKRMSEEHHYKVHSRVLRWMKSAERIKRELDEGYEKKWRGKSVEEIKEQKKVHDIVEILELLKSKECDRFFFRTGKYMKGGSERWKMVANGILEEGGEKKVGKVEVGL
ncbi:hypothetical protein M970_080020, partial [Encephalitozoon cuniculi EcunIII-L]